MSLEDIEKSNKGNPFFQYAAMLTGTLTVICSGMHFGWPSPSLPKLQNNESATISITNDEGSWLAVMPLLTAPFGSLIGGFILDKIGRKKVILFSCFPFLVSWIMIACAKSIMILSVGRLVAGISDALTFCALPMYLGEIAEPKIRGALCSSLAVTWTLGIFLINVIGSYFSISTTALISSIIPILCLLTFVWMPESPYYLLMKGRTERARRSLEILMRTKNVELELSRMVKEVREKNSGNSRRFLDLFTVKSNRKALYIMMGVRGTQMLSGVAAITFYAHTIFKQAENSNMVSSNSAAIIYFGAQLVLCVTSLMIVDRAGRRPLLIISLTGVAITLFIEGTYFLALSKLDNLTWIPLTGLICFMISFCIGMQTIPLLLLGELFSIDVKAFALGFSDVYFGVVVTIVSKFFQFTKDNFGLYVPFYAFFVCCIFGLLFIIFFVPETKDKTLEEIQDEFRGSSIKKITDIELKESLRMIPNS